MLPTTNKRQSVLRNLVLALLLVGCGEPRAENLVENPGFDTDISGWDFSGTCIVLGRDTFGGNGALAINCFSASSVETVSQCVAIPRTDLDFSAQTTDNGNAGPVSYALTAYSNADCTGTATTLVDPGTASVVPGGGCCGRTWTPLSRTDLAVPASARSVLIEIIVTSPADIALDDIRLGPSVFQDGFEP